MRANADPDGAQKNLLNGPLVLVQSAPACQEILSLWAHSLIQLDRQVQLTLCTAIPFAIRFFAGLYVQEVEV